MKAPRWPDKHAPGPAGSKLWKRTLKRMYGKVWRDYAAL